MATTTGSVGEQRGSAVSSRGALRIWVVPHTHWDREWYLPFEQLRIQLASTMDEVLERLERDESLFFTLDGQAILLEDYLAIRPGQQQRLRRLLASGRLVAGPCYVLSDEFLVGSESLVRNLLMGRQVCEQYGARPMDVGYAPDTFGHVAQLPQILRGFGIQAFVFWRGLGDEADRLGPLFWWQGPDGSRLLAVRLLEGYANARDLGRWTRQGGWVSHRSDLWPETAARRVIEFLERWRESIAVAGIHEVLLANGADHAPIQRDLPEMLAACRERLPGLSFQIGSYEGYLQAVRADHIELQTHEGELVGGKEACVVRSVNSTRIYLKQANEAAERALFVAEALASLAWLRSRRGDGKKRGRGDGEMVSIPHTMPLPVAGRQETWGEGSTTQDSGLSTQDLVLGSRQTASGLPGRAGVYPRPPTKGMAPGGGVQGPALQVGREEGDAGPAGPDRPPAPRMGENERREGSRRYEYPRNELRLAWRELLRNHPHDSLPGCSVDEVHRDMEQRFRSAEQIAREVQRKALAALAGAPAPSHSWKEDRAGHSLVNVLPWRRVGIAVLELPVGLQGTQHLVAETPRGSLPVQRVGRAAEPRAVVVAEVEGMGSLPLHLRPGPFAAPAAPAGVRGAASIENGYYRVEAAPNGTITVSDFRTGEEWAGLHWFEDEADRGDEYSFCPVDGEPSWDSRHLRAQVRVVRSGPLVAELEIALPFRLPRRLNRGRSARSRATVCYPIRTVVRLIAGVDRIEFQTTVENRAEDHRLRVRFPAPKSTTSVRAEGTFAMLKRPARPVWNGQWREPPTATHHTLGTVAAGKLALTTRGLPEYEALPNRQGGVDLALTLLRCVGWLSWSDLATRPGADEPHIATPEAQCPGIHTFEYAISLRGDDTDAALLRAGLDYRVGLVDGPAGIDLPGTLQVEGDGFAFSALKGAEEGDGVVLRLFNPGGTPTAARVTAPGFEVRRCRMDETMLEGNLVETVPMQRGEIATLRIESAQSDQV